MGVRERVYPSELNYVTALNWILNGTGKWHAWPRGGRATMCGRINIEHLRVTPAKQITHEKPTGALCEACARKTGLTEHAACGDTRTSAWAGQIRRHLAHVRARVADVLVVQLAARLAEIGAPTERNAQSVFEQVQALLLRPVWTRKAYVGGRTRSFARLPNLKEALEKLPPNTKALQRVADTLLCWRRITNREPNVDRYRVDRVIEVMLQIPAPEPYITHLFARGHPHLAFMFHPNTLLRAKKETALRGVFAGSTDYWDHTQSQLHVVTD